MTKHRLPVGVGVAQPPREVSPLEGRWDLTVHGPQGDYPSWLEVRRSGYRTLVGSFVGQFGSVRPIGPGGTLSSQA